MRRKNRSTCQSRLKIIMLWPNWYILVVGLYCGQWHYDGRHNTIETISQPQQIVWLTNCCWLPTVKKKETNNMKSKWQTWCKWETAKCTLYSTSCSRWASGWVCEGLCWVSEGFWIPTCWYWQRGTLALGVTRNTKPQRKVYAFCWNIG